MARFEESMLALRCRSAAKVLLFVASLVASPCLGAHSVGSLNGLVRDRYGEPLPNLLVSLVDLFSEHAIPVLTTSDEHGQIFVSNVAAGSYVMGIKSSLYRGPLNRIVEIRPGETAVVSLVVREIVGLGYESAESVGVKSLLRSQSRRMVFRGLDERGAEPEESTRPFFNDAVVEVYTNAGVGEDSLVFPGDSSQGTTTNFAARDSLPNGTDYILAGQFNSGNDSLFRIKNWINHDLGDNHQLRLLMGYGRIAFTEPSLALLDDPSLIGYDVGYLRDAGTTKVLTVGFEDRWQLEKSLSLFWGMEMNQVRQRHADSFVSPNAGIEYKPTGSTAIRLGMLSKRETASNSIALPDGERLLLNDSVQFSNIQGNRRIGRSRYYEASVNQSLGPRNRVEFAAFESRLLGVSPYLFGKNIGSGSVDFLEFDNSDTRTRAWRVKIEHRLTDNLRAAFSYVRGTAPSLDTVQRNEVYVDPSALGALFRRRGFYALAAELEAYIPQSSTRFTALFRSVPEGDPITAVDPLSDVYETPNRSVNLFVRQLIPVPVSLLRLLGLDFLSDYRLEALLDIRNLANQELAVLPGAGGHVVLLQQPRSLRGGLALNF